ncbi:hypothetical protein [Prosthecochloris sp.]|uniref:hypothetical protein n=1 Tax=Prosthecochloris sp. TaxID=290513 RepID=UPI0025F9EDC6|nr:hypothetical protein [Prosthecochloris sp.]
MPTKRWGNHDYEVMTDFAGEKHLLADDGVDTKVAQIDAIIADIIDRLGYQVSEDSILNTALERLGYSNEFTPDQLWDAVFRGRTGVECMSIDSMFDEGRLYQDANGTTPVTGVEQPVGLMLDGSQRLRLGSELVTNGDFSDGLTGWSTAGTVENGALTVDAIGASINMFQQEINGSGTPVGSLYWLQYEVVENSLQPGTGSMMAVHNDSDFKLLSGSQLPSAVGTHRVLVQRVTDTASILHVFLHSQQASGSITVDNISLRETYGNHPHQLTDINRPVLSARVNGLRSTEDLSAGGWQVFNNATVTGKNTINLPEEQSRITHAWATNAPIGATAKGSIVLSGTGTVTMKVLRRFTDGGTYEETDRVIDLTTTPTRYTVEHTIQYENQSGFILEIIRKINDTATEVTATKADLRYSNDGIDLPAYQRVGDVDAIPDDYDWQNFPMYFAFNGTNQYLKVTGMQPEVDEVFVSAAMRTSCAEEHRILAAYGWMSQGSFQFYSRMPGGNGFASKGDIGRYAIEYDTVSPSSMVMTGLAKISDDVVLLRINGQQQVENTDDQGVGNYNNYKLYIGSRNGTSMFYNGRLYGFLLVFDNPTDTIITTIERELNRKAKIYA